MAGMSSFVGRVGSLNLTWHRHFSVLPTQGAIKCLLAPPPTMMSVKRGAKIECGIEWVRPVEPPSISKAKSGDMEGLPSIPPEKPVPDLENSVVLENADPNVQKLFSFYYQHRGTRRQMIEKALIDSVKRHKWDDSSPEVKLARMTASIRRLQEHAQALPYETRSQVILKETIERRKKRLKWLRMYDYKRFEWILERLNLVYYPPPPQFHPVMRSVSMQQLTDEFCEKIRTKRLDAYRDDLERKKPEFMKRKMETMRAIVEDEKSLNIPPSFTEDEILEIEKAYIEKTEELARIEKPAESIF